MKGEQPTPWTSLLWCSRNEHFWLARFGQHLNIFVLLGMTRCTDTLLFCLTHKKWQHKAWHPTRFSAKYFNSKLLNLVIDNRNDKPAPLQYLVCRSRHSSAAHLERYSICHSPTCWPARRKEWSFLSLGHFWDLREEVWKQKIQEKGNGKGCREAMPTSSLGSKDNQYWTTFCWLLSDTYSTPLVNKEMFGDSNYTETIKPPMNECEAYHFRRNILGTIVVTLLLATKSGLQNQPHAMKNCN